jgi:hypothetical protein
MEKTVKKRRLFNGLMEAVEDINQQATTLIMMVRKFPDTLQRMKQLAA